MFLSDRLSPGNGRGTGLSAGRTAQLRRRKDSVRPRAKPCLNIAANVLIRPIVGGECPKNRIIRTPDGEPGLNYLCRGFKKFFQHAIPSVERIIAQLPKEPIRPLPRM